jgi:hypothetical protein
VAQKFKVRLAEGKSVELDAKKSTVADFAAAFIDDAVERVRGAAAANQITNVEMLAEGFLQVLNERVSYFLAHVSPEERELVLEWLVTGVVGGFAHDFLRHYVKVLAAQEDEGPGS